MRAASQNVDATKLMGVSVNRVSALAWAIGGALATMFSVAFVVIVAALLINPDLARTSAQVVRQTLAVVRTPLTAGAFPEGLREAIRRPGRRLFVIWGVVDQGTTYRMAWEPRTASPRSGEPDRIVIWAYGKHEGFYDRLWRRARA